MSAPYLPSQSNSGGSLPPELVGHADYTYGVHSGYMFWYTVAGVSSPNDNNVNWAIIDPSLLSPATGDVVTSFAYNDGSGNVIQPTIQTSFHWNKWIGLTT